jgi:translation initiation factor 2 beta subunit (eIF-2beta)/eIF-5
MVNEKVRKYADSFVFCPQCGGPDTEFLKDKKDCHIKCNICGAKTRIRDFL